MARFGTFWHLLSPSSRRAPGDGRSPMSEVRRPKSKGEGSPTMVQCCIFRHPLRDSRVAGPRREAGRTARATSWALPNSCDRMQYTLCQGECKGRGEIMLYRTTMITSRKMRLTTKCKHARRTRMYGQNDGNKIILSGDWLQLERGRQFSQIPRIQDHRG